ncbi:hypothetical protein F7R91_05745 [Streptomyces luteolifulvus]|uniref:Uncharacterized protein n=1 Tax=Streptomyces luteolifulvus TaxID=2615112 RepID=A0A6H9V7R0_9ACTN|nr:hypothetical protein [Streptomyces luteolifulvus]KAB1149260.1 hypothetical protein F7R91_05745 [Streptomyces luteolifulvus]
MSLTRVVLATGRSLDLTELQLSATYGGMLEGYPCKPINDIRIKGLLRACERAFPTAPVHLVPPPREHPDQFAGGFGPVEVLPPVACVGTFHSTPLDPAHDPVLYRSSLTVVWFQPAPQVPSDCDAENDLREIAWEELARDHELQKGPPGWRNPF